MNKKETSEYIALLKEEQQKKEDLFFLSIQHKKINGWRIRKNKDGRYQAYTWCPKKKKTLRWWVYDLLEIEEETKFYNDQVNIVVNNKIFVPKMKGKTEQVKKMFLQGISQAEIAKKMGVSPSTICRIVQKQ